MIDSGAENYFSASAETESLEDAVVECITRDEREEILQDILSGLIGEEKRTLSSNTEGISPRQHERMYRTPRHTMEVWRGRLLEDLRCRITAEKEER